MLPGQHEFRMRGPGDVYVTVAKLKAVDFDPGRPYYIVIEGAQAQSVLEWKVRGGKWEPVTKEFLYPPQGTKSSA